MPELAAEHDSQTRDSGRSHAPHAAPVVFAGALPPPVTGMTAMTAVIIDELRRRDAVRIINWSPGKPMKGWRWKLRRAAAVAKTLVVLPLCGLGRRRRFYYALSSGGGLYYDLAILALARLLGYRLAVHHHAYSYLDRPEWRMRRIDRLVGPSGAHVVHCRLMRDHFLAAYPQSRSDFWVVPPTIASPLEAVDVAPPAGPSTLGLMSNLSFAKGLAEAIAVFEQLAAQSDVRLVLAGPCMGSGEERLIERTLAHWPGRVEYRGPVYGDAKAKFFAEIDVFLFPTKYRNESWGIVLTEALAYGRPVLAAARGCVPWIVDGQCGLAFDRSEDFAAGATEQIRRWRADAAEFASAHAAALVRVGQLQEDALLEFPALIERLTAAPVATAS
ncbi:MAG: glycosyltransferase family 4 protein [Planctomycetales bacterium]|nr:glycosyltransferase family 4 protein [Planctomycetales bacterium]